MIYSKMRKKYYIIILFLIGTSSVFAEGIKFGIHFDPTIVWLRTDNKVNDGISLGFDFGMSLDYFFAKNYAFATGISMFNTGGNVNVNGFPSDYRIQYLKVPVGLKFKTHRIGRMIYSADMGFAAMARMTSKSESVSGFREQNANKDVKFFNVGWHFGGLAAYSLGGEAALFGGLSFLNTFTDMFKIGAVRKTTSGNIMLRIGIMF